MYEDLYLGPAESTAQALDPTTRTDVDDSELTAAFGWRVTKVVADILSRIAVPDVSLYASLDSRNPDARNETECPAYESLIERWSSK